jgi:hypothetical protein
LPTGPPFDERDWATLLTFLLSPPWTIPEQPLAPLLYGGIDLAAVHQDLWHRMASQFVPRNPTIEAWFLYEANVLGLKLYPPQHRELTTAEATVLLKRTQTRTALKATLTRQFREPLRRFLRQVRPLSKMSGVGHFRIRLIERTPDPDYSEHLLYTGIVKVAELRSVLGDVFAAIEPALSQWIAPAGGRPAAFQRIAHWWALTVFE